MSTRTTTTALIIGGGIAGPVAAMALQKAGIDATVYEAYQGTADGVGGMLGIAPNGVRALSVLDAQDLVLRIGKPVQSMIMESWTGKRLAEFGSQDGPPAFHAVWRGDLYREMYDMTVARGLRIEHGKRLVRAVDDGDGVTAYFDDGTSARADILIGADGIRSTVRTMIDPAAPRPRYTGLLGFGGGAGRTGLRPTDTAMHMTYGKRAFFAYWVDDDGETGWFVNLPHEKLLTLQETRAIGAAEWLRVLRKAVADDRTPAPRILANLDPEQLVMVGGIEDLPPVPTWSKGRIVLVGDAAHAASSSSGQGASIAIESAVQLARCLRDLPNPSEAFAAYERLRRERVERIIALGARKASEKAAGPVGRVMRDLIFPVMMKLLAKPEKMAWQYDYAIDWDAPVEPVGALAGR